MKDLIVHSPVRLKEIQQWVASIIAQPLNPDQTSQEYTPRGESLKNEAPHFVTANKFLQAHERIQIYNQQYWWRFYKTLQELFPTVVRLFGHYDFNRLIVTPYLTVFPPGSWSLIKMGSKLPLWLNRFYKEADKSVVHMCAKIDWAFQESFVCKSHAPISLSGGTPDDITDALSLKIKLQPHVHLIKCDGPFLKFREAFLNESIEHWVENNFPSLPKDGTYYYIIYRSPTNSLIYWESLSKTQYKLLKLLKKGSSLMDACAFLEDEPGPAFTEALQNIQFWFKDWMEKQLLYTVPC